MKNYLLVLTIALTLPVFTVNAGIADMLAGNLNDAEIAHVVVTGPGGQLFL